MTPAERIGALLIGQTPDRVPVMPFVLGYAAKVCGMNLGDFYADGDKCFRAQLLAMDLHGYDQTPFYGYAAIGAWEFGGKIEFPYGPGHSAPIVIKHPVEEPEDVDKLEVPEPPAGSYKESIKVCRSAVKLGMPAIFQIGSAFTATGNILEPARMMLWLRRQPDLVHKVLRKAAEFFIASAEYFVKQFGAERCIAFDGGPTESNKMISAKQFGEFAFPYINQVHRKVLSLGVNVILDHPCADQTKNISYYEQIRAGAPGIYIWNFGPETPLELQIEKFGKRDIIMGNVDPPSFQNKPYEEVLMLCKENIEKGGKNPRGYILGPGCEMPPLAPPVNVHALIKAAKEYGRY